MGSLVLMGCCDRSLGALLGSTVVLQRLRSLLLLHNSRGVPLFKDLMSLFADRVGFEGHVTKWEWVAMVRWVVVFDSSRGLLMQKPGQAENTQCREHRDPFIQAA
ncbi:hypothetical protein QBC43DRAFT_333106 [Cladorrhinum sp. PSN259]|nr:hypothetical protein QBC43DRAFT_333106 [Cladorrhinum sp. PSN259]